MAECSICVKKMQNASLSRHMEQMHEGKKIEYEEQSTKGRGLHQIEDVKKGVFNACPIEGCEGGGRDKFGMYRHFCLNSIAKKMKREGADAVCMAKIYLAVVQAVLLDGADSWVLSDRNMK